MGTSVPRLSDTEIAQRLAALKSSPRSDRGWQRDGDSIAKEFVLGSFTEATQFIAKLAEPANAMDHHPDVQLYRYKRVKVVLTTHDAGGVTKNDFDLAAKIDALQS